jgi:hypothetical protein
VRLHRYVQQAAREGAKVARAATATHRQLRERLIAVALVTLAIDLVCAIAAFYLERHEKQTEIKTLGSALFWTSAQLLTVSSQMRNPLSAGGRVLDVFMEAYAITVVAALAGSFGAFFHRRGSERDTAGG